MNNAISEFKSIKIEQTTISLSANVPIVNKVTEAKTDENEHMNIARISAQIALQAINTINNRQHWTETERNEDQNIVTRIISMENCFCKLGETQRDIFNTVKDLSKTQKELDSIKISVVNLMQCVYTKDRW
jgi:hypothetical protein